VPGCSPFSVISRALTHEGGDSIFLIVQTNFHPRDADCFTLRPLRCSFSRNHRSGAKVYFCVRTCPLGHRIPATRLDIIPGCTELTSASRLTVSYPPSSTRIFGICALKRFFCSVDSFLGVNQNKKSAKPFNRGM